MIGYGSAAVNDQLVPVVPDQAYHPLVFGRIAEDMWPAVGTYQQPPVMSQQTNFGSVPPWNGYVGAAGTGTYPTNNDTEGSPFSLKMSPLWWALGFLGLSLFLLHVVFFRKGDK